MKRIASWNLRRLFHVVGCMVLSFVVVGLITRSGFEPTASAAEGKKAEEKKKVSYVGVKMCRVCHKDRKTGDQYGQWEKTKHAEAYKTLASAKSKEVAAKLGVTNPQKDMKCLKCHVTAADEPAALKKRLKATDGVGCEACHGPGQYYSKKDVFEKGREVAMQHGLIVPDEKLCVKCHNDESPTFPGEFNFKEAWKKVLHPDPTKKK